MSNKESGGGFTTRDLELLAAAMSCTKSPVEVDYKLFAEKGGFKNAASAKASWNGLKKKMWVPTLRCPLCDAIADRIAVRKLVEVPLSVRRELFVS